MKLKVTIGVLCFLLTILLAAGAVVRSMEQTSMAAEDALKQVKVHNKWITTHERETGAALEAIVGVQRSMADLKVQLNRIEDKIERRWP